MRALIQRVSQSEVTIAGDVVGRIQNGMLILVCAMRGDDESVCAKLAQKISKLRIFKDDEGRMNRSLIDTGGAVLIVSQFTLGADTRRGNRPGFSQSASPNEGKRLYEAFVAEFKTLVQSVKTGQFGADMQVTLTNDGPVTIWIDTDD